MSIITFTEEQIKVLSNNKCVSNVSNKSISYTDEFKQLFISENENGKLPRLNFEEHGFNIDILGIERIKSSGKRWRRSCRKEGILGLIDMRKEKSGKFSDKEEIVLASQEKFIIISRVIDKYKNL